MGLYNAGAAFADFLKNQAPVYARDAVNKAGSMVVPAAPIMGAALGAVRDFGSGVLGGPAPLSDTATVHLPAARPVAVFAHPAAAAAAAPVVVAPAAGKGKGKAADDPTAALAGLSFRQLMALSETADHLAPRGAAPRIPSASDTAGALYIKNQQALLDQAIAAAKGDPGKQAALQFQFNEKVLKPLALKGNTADEHIYDQ